MAKSMKKLPAPVANPPKLKVSKLPSPVAKPPHALQPQTINGEFPVASPPHAVVHRTAAENSPYPV